MNYAMNVDRPERTCTLHHIDCSYVHEGTPFKGEGELARDGGWYYTKTIEEAETLHREQFLHMKLKKCSSCM